MLFFSECLKSVLKRDEVHGPGLAPSVHACSPWCKQRSLDGHARHHRHRYLLVQNAHDSMIASAWSVSIRPDAALQSTGRFSVLN